MNFILRFSRSILAQHLTAKAIVIFCCLPIHECAHAWMAEKLGDNTGRIAGRVTLNPFRHLDLWGTLLLISFGVGYAKPVPVNTYNLRNARRDFAVVSLAGPLSNLIVAFGTIFVEHAIISVTGYGTIPAFLSYILKYTALINISLMIFNMIPVPPLDGYHVLLAFAPNHIYYKAVNLERYAMYMLLGLLLFLSLFRISPITIAAQNLFKTVNALIGF